MEYALPIKCTESNHQEASILYLSLEILTIFFGTLRLLQTTIETFYDRLKNGMHFEELNLDEH